MVEWVSSLIQGIAVVVSAILAVFVAGRIAKKSVNEYQLRKDFGQTKESLLNDLADSSTNLGNIGVEWSILLDLGRKEGIFGRDANRRMKQVIVEFQEKIKLLLGKMRLQINLSAEQSKKFKDKISRFCYFEDSLDDCLEEGDFDTYFDSLSSVVKIRGELTEIEEFIQSA